jgi:hypothetical protein
MFCSILNWPILAPQRAYANVFNFKRRIANNYKHGFVWYLIICLLYGYSLQNTLTITKSARLGTKSYWHSLSKNLRKVHSVHYFNRFPVKNETGCSSMSFMSVLLFIRWCDVVNASKFILSKSAVDL